MDRLHLIRNITQSEPAALRKLDPSVPRDLETIVHKAMAREPERRYPTADELADDLQRFLNDEPIKARQAGTVERLRRWRRRNPALAFALLCLTITLLVGATVSTWLAVRAT